MISATKEFTFIAAHRVEGHPKCGKLHGHNYRVEVTVAHPASSRMDISQSELDKLGFVLDFGILKQLLKPRIDALDHTYMVSQTNIEANCIYYRAAVDNKRTEDLFLLPIRQSSAELLALWFKQMFQEVLYKEGYDYIAVVEVKVWETPTAYATS